jgi:hypothetical protein
MGSILKGTRKKTLLQSLNPQLPNIQVQLSDMETMNRESTLHIRTHQITANHT